MYLYSYYLELKKEEAFFTFAHLPIFVMNRHW